QAEDGIRDGHVTGVQTCALPISFPAGWVAPVHCEAGNPPRWEWGRRLQSGVKSSIPAGVRLASPVPSALILTTATCSPITREMTSWLPSADQRGQLSNSGLVVSATRFEPSAFRT